MLAGSAEAAARSPEAALLLEARRLRDARDWAALARLDAALAALDPRHPGYPDAEELRVDWRLGRGSAEAAGEALALLDGWPGPGIEQIARRALAGSQSGDATVAALSLDALARSLGPRARLTPLAREWALAAFESTRGEALTPNAERLRLRITRVTATGS
jgi:hypothetical protein